MASTKARVYADTEKIDFPEFVTKRKAAELLHCSVRNIERLMWSGKIKCYQPTPHKTLIELDSLRALVSTPANNAMLKGGENK
jgi:hypothetical protein